LKQPYINGIFIQLVEKLEEQWRTMDSIYSGKWPIMHLYSKFEAINVGRMWVIQFRSTLRFKEDLQA
jgi:hypothetical protein